MTRKNRVRVHFYTFVTTDIPRTDGSTEKHTVSMAGIKNLARYLNNWRARNPKKRVLVCFLSDGSGKFIKVTKFLQIEYAAQRWLVGDKERLLANAQESGYEVKWNHGLKPIQRSDSLDNLKV